jgi:hypothetical protein
MAQAASLDLAPPGTQEGLPRGRDQQAVWTLACWSSPSPLLGKPGVIAATGARLVVRERTKSSLCRSNHLVSLTYARHVLHAPFCKVKPRTYRASSRTSTAHPFQQKKRTQSSPKIRRMSACAQCAAQQFRRQDWLGGSGQLSDSADGQSEISGIVYGMGWEINSIFCEFRSSRWPLVGTANDGGVLEASCLRCRGVWPRAKAAGVADTIIEVELWIYHVGWTAGK